MLKEIAERVSKKLISNMDKMRIKRINDGVAPGAGVKWTAAKTIDQIYNISAENCEGGKISKKIYGKSLIIAETR